MRSLKNILKILAIPIGLGLTTIGLTTILSGCSDKRIYDGQLGDKNVMYENVYFPKSAGVRGDSYLTITYPDSTQIFMDDWNRGGKISEPNDKVTRYNPDGSIEYMYGSGDLEIKHPDGRFERFYKNKYVSIDGKVYKSDTDVGRVLVQKSRVKREETKNLLKTHYDSLYAAITQEIADTLIARMGRR